MKILLVEDDRQFTHLLQSALVAQHYTVDIASDGQTGWELIRSRSYDLVVLDVELPQLDGISVCRRLRESGNQVLVMLLTARGSSNDKILGLDAGADDYVVKPVVLSELEARIRALLRRISASGSPLLEWGLLSLNPNTCVVTYGSVALPLTAKEYALLELFLRNSQRIYSQSAIVDRLWSLEDAPPGEEAVRTHIKRLRQKLKAAGAAELIETVHGLGYRLNAAYRTESPQSAAAPSHLGNIEQSIWRENQPYLLERIALLEQATALLQQAVLPEVFRRQAQQEAHRLIGSLGILGIPKATDLARELEALFRSPVTGNTPRLQSLHAQITTLRELVEKMTLAPRLSELNRTEPVAEESHARLLIVSRSETVNPLLVNATMHGMQATIALNAQAARQAVERLCPDLIWLELSSDDQADDREDELTWIGELSQQSPSIPILMVENGTGQITLFRSKDHRILPKNTSAFDAITQALKPPQAIETKIMILDDDLIMLMLLQNILEPWGFQITTFNHPQSFWENLNTITPDLLVLDVQMPDMDGISLCQQLRNHDQWAWLPILILTGSRDAETIQQIFMAGADDYIAKPIVGPELVTRILNRLERTRLLRNQSRLLNSGSLG